MHFSRGDPDLRTFQMIGKDHDTRQILGTGRKAMKNIAVPLPAHSIQLRYTSEYSSAGFSRAWLPLMDYGFAFAVVRLV